MDFQTPSNYRPFDEGFTYRERHTHRHDIAERLITAAGSALTGVLAFRFVLALLGANPANGFASFIYSVTQPFVAPFYSLFSYDHPSVGAASFEGYALVAIAVYGLGAAILTRLVSITRYS